MSDVAPSPVTAVKISDEAWNSFAEAMATLAEFQAGMAATGQTNIIPRAQLEQLQKALQGFEEFELGIMAGERLTETVVLASAVPVSAAMAAPAFLADDKHFAEAFCNLTFSVKVLAKKFGLPNEAAAYKRAKNLGLPARSELYSLAAAGTATIPLGEYEITLVPPQQIDAAATAAPALTPQAFNDVDFARDVLNLNMTLAEVAKKHGIPVGSVAAKVEKLDLPPRRDVMLMAECGTTALEWRGLELLIVRKEGPSPAAFVALPGQPEPELVVRQEEAAPDAVTSAAVLPEDEEDDIAARLATYEFDEAVLALLGQPNMPTAAQLLAVLEDEVLNTEDYPILTGAHLAELSPEEWQEVAGVDAATAAALFQNLRSKFLSDEDVAPEEEPEDEESGDDDLEEGEEPAIASPPAPALKPELEPEPARALAVVRASSIPAPAAAPLLPPPAPTQAAPKPAKAATTVDVAAFMAEKAAKAAARREALGDLLGNLDVALLAPPNNLVNAERLEAEIAARGFKLIHRLAEDGKCPWHIMRHDDGVLFLFRPLANSKGLEARFAVQAMRLDGNERLPQVSCLSRYCYTVEESPYQALRRATVSLIMFNAGDKSGAQVLQERLQASAGEVLRLWVPTPEIGTPPREVRQRLFAPGVRATLIR